MSRNGCRGVSTTVGDTDGAKSAGDEKSLSMTEPALLVANAHLRTQSLCFVCALAASQEGHKPELEPSGLKALNFTDYKSSNNYILL